MGKNAEKVCFPDEFGFQVREEIRMLAKHQLVFCLFQGSLREVSVYRGNEVNKRTAAITNDRQEKRQSHDH